MREILGRLVRTPQGALGLAIVGLIVVMATRIARPMPGMAKISSTTMMPPKR